MKRNLVLGFLAMLAISGCQVKEEGELAPEGKTFTATMEAMADDAAVVDTKTSMDSYGNVLWKKGDQVSIFVASTINQHFQVTDASDGKTAAALNPVESPGFVAGGDIPNNVAYYPYAATAAIAKRSGGAYLISDISLPATQNYAESSFSNGAFPMTAVTSSTNDYNLKFKNVLGGLKLHLKGTATIVSISVSGNNNEILCGAAEITVSGTDAPTINLTDATAKTVTLDCGDGVQLNEETATAFIIALPPMTMTGGFTVVVTDTEGKQMEIKTTKTQTITRSNIISMPAVNYVGKALVPHYVDLGLSVKWATCNLGATSTEEFGDYYAWGETEPYYISQEPLTWSEGRSGYNWESYKWCDSLGDALTKYNTNSNDGIVDNIKRLALDDDVANTVLGGNWRMPTSAEYGELINYCSREWTTINGVYGWKVTSEIPGYTGKWVFFPAAGQYNNTDLENVGTYGYYWSSTLYGNPWEAYHLRFDEWNFSMNSYYRRYGRTVRPVLPFSGEEMVYVSNIQLRAVEHLEVGDTEILTTKLFPKMATNTSLAWSSSNSSVVSVNSAGKVTAISDGQTTITASATDGSNVSATCQITVSAIAGGLAPIPDAIDLGLSVKWASFNLGASAPEEYGDYFAWGEVETYYDDGHGQDNPCNNWRSGKSGYNWPNYIWYNEYGESITKYNTNAEYGPKDNETKLQMRDDVAHVKLGGNWRMPTSVEYNELINNCSLEWTTINGVCGWKVTSNISGYTDKWVFFPAAGQYNNTDLENVGIYGYYWSSSLYGNPWEAYHLRFDEWNFSMNSYYRRYGRSVRPVTE